MEWNPNGQFNFILMDNDIKDENIVKQFVTFHNLPLIINDIWKYGANNLKKYPTKITNRGMVYNGMWQFFIELKFGKESIHLYKFRMDLVRNPTLNIKNVFVAGAPFSYLKFKDFLLESFVL